MILNDFGLTKIYEEDSCQPGKVDIFLMVLLWCKGRYASFKQNEIIMLNLQLLQPAVDSDSNIFRLCSGFRVSEIQVPFRHHQIETLSLQKYRFIRTVVNWKRVSTTPTLVVCWYPLFVTK